MQEPLKILPAVMLTCATLFAAKAVGLWSDIRAELVGLRPAYAADQAAGEDHTRDDHGDGKAPVQGDHSAERHGEDAATETGAGHGHTNDGEPSNGVDHGASYQPVPTTDLIPSSLLSAAEVDVLESLSERRQMLEKRERELDMREKLLMAAEAKVDQKVVELKQIEARVKDLLGQMDEKKAAQTESLIKVYEAMKAKDAARIFENLNTDILINVAAGMKEAKVAAIMAAMDSQKAQQLTYLLATRLNLPDEDVLEGLAETGQSDG